jgi:hypothetical protein
VQTGHPSLIIVNCRPSPSCAPRKPRMEIETNTCEAIADETVRI